MPRNLLLAALALGSATVSAQTVNTQVNGITLTNGLSSVTDSAALGSFQNLATGVGYLSDGDTSTYAFNIGKSSSGSLQGNFSGTPSSSATGVYLIGMATNVSGTVRTINGPSFSVQLALLGGLSSARIYGDADFTVTAQKIETISFYDSTNGMVLAGMNPETQLGAAYYYSYLYIPFSDFSTTYGQVVGIKLGNFTPGYPDLSYIGIGYSGAGAPVPEPSTYGLMLGGLALAVVAARRRKTSK